MHFWSPGAIVANGKDEVSLDDRRLWRRRNVFRLLPTRFTLNEVFVNGANIWNIKTMNIIARSRDLEC